MPSPDRSGTFWADIWADPDLAPVILQHGRIFAITQRNFLRALEGTFGSLGDKRILDFGCGDGRLLAPLACRERVLYEPSPVYADALAKLATDVEVRHATRVVADVAEIADASLDLVIAHGVAHYLDGEALAEAIRVFSRKLADHGLGIVLGDLPHSSTVVDALGAVFAHPGTVLQTLGQVVTLARTRYASNRIERHSIRELETLAADCGCQLRRLPGRSFNRARKSVLLEPR